MTSTPRIRIVTLLPPCTLGSDRIEVGERSAGLQARDVTSLDVVLTARAPAGA
jgi:hypothetical protein